MTTPKDILISIYDTLRGNTNYTQFTEYENEIDEMYIDTPHANDGESIIKIHMKDGKEYHVKIQHVFSPASN